MNEKESLINNILTNVAKEISITDTMIDKAESSYKAVGKWIGDGIENKVLFYPQGSIGLGTTIKPISDKDDYDIDAVCLLLDGKYLSASEIKNIVGDRLKAHKLYKEKIEEEGEGKRCWTIPYEEFHMDILPSAPLDKYLEPNHTEIRITHKNSEGQYSDKYSNPRGYIKWFDERMHDIAKKARLDHQVRNQVKIEEIPLYRIKTPLQMAIQLLKRHRDIMFANNDEFSPISVIITTLAAKSYNSEENVYDAIKSILEHMNDYIENRNGVVWIQNPVMAKENFADKWQSYPCKKDAYYQWHASAKKDFIDNPLKAVGIDDFADMLQKSLGQAPVKRAMTNYAKGIRSAREKEKLYSAGILSGLTTNNVPGAILDRKHTFYGK